MKKRLRVFIISLGLVISLVFIRLIYALLNDNPQLSKVSVVEYDNLFSKGAKPDLHFFLTLKSATRNPISRYEYKKKFLILVLKINLKTKDGLTKILHMARNHSEKMSGVTSPLADNPFFVMECRSGLVDTALLVNFSLEGDSIKTITKNDTTACYYLKLGTFSIGYNNNADEDIWGSEGDSGKVPASMMFIKRKKNLYFILMRAQKPKEEIPDTLLYNIVQR